MIFNFKIFKNLIFYFFKKFQTVETLFQYLHSVYLKKEGKL